MGKARNLSFDVNSILKRVKQLPKPSVDSVSVSLPFITVNLSCSNKDKEIAREVIIRLRDKRVLVAYQCCGDCIKLAIESLQDMRTLLVNKQVELPNEDSALFLLFDLMLAGIRQFLTYTEFFDPYVNRDEYQDALETLRGHLLRCVSEIAKIGDTSPRLNERMEFDPNWTESVYLPSLSS